jgi:hypothetical protein
MTTIKAGGQTNGSEDCDNKMDGTRAVKIDPVRSILAERACKESTMPYHAQQVATPPHLHH